MLIEEESLEPLKLRMGDRDVPYQTTKLSAIQTRSDIDSILAKWGIINVAWTYDPKNNNVVVRFQLPLEKFGDTQINPLIVLEPPRIWKKKGRGKADSINWRVSMRILYWMIKSLLEMAYAMQSAKAVAFLPFIQTGDNQVLKDLVLGNLGKLKSLEDNSEQKSKPRFVNK